MDKKLLDIIVCPMCNSKLTYVKNDHLLLCQFDRVTFPFDDGIPVLLPEAATSITGEALKSLCNQ